MKKNSDLKIQYLSQENDRDLLLKQLIFQKKESQKLRKELDHRKKEAEDMRAMDETNTNYPYPMANDKSNAKLRTK